jgi:N-methylhydantoinase A
MVEMPGKSQRFKLGIDIGGTFTDVLMLDQSSGEVNNGKLLSTPQDLSKGGITMFKRMLRASGQVRRPEACSE